MNVSGDFTWLARLQAGRPVLAIAQSAALFEQWQLALRGTSPYCNELAYNAHRIREYSDFRGRNSDTHMLIRVGIADLSRFDFSSELMNNFPDYHRSPLFIHHIEEEFSFNTRTSSCRFELANGRDSRAIESRPRSQMEQRVFDILTQRPGSMTLREATEQGITGGSLAIRSTPSDSPNPFCQIHEPPRPQHEPPIELIRWCEANGWHSIQWQEIDHMRRQGEWWGFQGGAMMESPIPWKPDPAPSPDIRVPDFHDFDRRLGMILKAICVAPCGSVELRLLVPGEGYRAVIRFSNGSNITVGIPRIFAPTFSDSASERAIELLDLAAYLQPPIEDFWSQHNQVAQSVFEVAQALLDWSRNP